MLDINSTVSFLQEASKTIGNYPQLKMYIEPSVESAVIFLTLALTTGKKGLPFIFTVIYLTMLILCAKNGHYLLPSVFNIVSEKGWKDFVGLGISTLIILGYSTAILRDKTAHDVDVDNTEFVLFLFPLFALANIIFFNNDIYYIVYFFLAGSAMAAGEEQAAYSKIARSDKF